MEPARGPGGQRQRRGQRAAILAAGCLACAGLLALLAALARVGLQRYVGVPDPARLHHELADGEELAAVCRSLMADRGQHGTYVQRWPSGGDFAPSDAARLRGARARRPGLTPAALPQLEPIIVRVSGEHVVLHWEAPACGYGYEMVLLREPDGEAAASLRQRNVELIPGIWSRLAYH